MPLLTVTKTYADLQVLNESDLDNIKNSIETFINITKLDEDNLQNLAVTTTKIANAAVTDIKLATDSVTTLKIKDLNVTVDKLAADSVTTTKIKDLNVTLAKMAANSVDSSKIVDGSIAAADLGTDAVETAKIKNANVTLAKLASNSVDSSKIVDGSIAKADLGFTLSVENTAENVNILRGQIRHNALNDDVTIIKGAGFSIGNAVVTEFIQIDFTTAFTDSPVVIMEQNEKVTQAAVYQTKDISTTQLFFDPGVGPSFPSTINFIVIGKQ